MSEKRALLLGDGGREHQLAIELGGSVRTLYATGNNLGVAELPNGVNLAFGASEAEKVVHFAQQKETDLVVVGPEGPLIVGIADALRAKGLSVFGPGYEGAQLEASKAFGVEFMRQFDIPHPPTHIMTNYDEAADLVADNPTGWVLKADKPAGGKGVVLPQSAQEANKTLKGMFSGQLFGGAGAEVVVIQERLHGPEVSVTAVTDGNNFVKLPYSQDHKRRDNGDRGPNTGGMGAYAPLPDGIVNDHQSSKIDSIIEKTIYGIRQLGMDYRGVLYIGMMLAEEYQGDPVVIEYNVRFGDPETQVVLPLTRSLGVDIYEMLKETAKSQLQPGLNSYASRHPGETALTVCLATPGYPDNPRTDQLIRGLEKRYNGADIIHGGTKRLGQQVVASSGRVLYVTGRGQTADEAAANAYAAIGPQAINFDNMHYRTDIGHQARPPLNQNT